MASADASSFNITDISYKGLRYDPYEFLAVQPALSVVLIIILIIASVVGSCGNVLILVAVATHNDLQSVESVFVVNLACSDLYVTLVADPLSIVGKTMGWRFFDQYPDLCRVIAYLCTISCVTSLMTLSALSCNRYVLICHQNLYNKLFTIRNSIIMCCCFYGIGFALVAMNFFGVGDHSFDHKSLECIWDRMANHNYTIVFSIVMVVIPITVTGLSYIRLFLFVRKSKLKIHHHVKNNSRSVDVTGSAAQPSASFDMFNSQTEATSVTRLENPNNDAMDHGFQEEGKISSAGKQDLDSEAKVDSNQAAEEGEKQPGEDRSKVSQRAAPDGAPENRLSANCNKSKQLGSSRSSKSSGGGIKNPTVRLARTLFIIYLVFSVCWLPFSLLIVLDADDTFAHEIHVTIVAWAHLHPSINWLVYYFTHNKFRLAFRKLLRLDKCCG